MKLRLIIPVLVLATGIAIYACGGNDSATENPAGNSAEGTKAVSGVQLYTDNCMVCHGVDGKAGMSGATDLSTSVLSHESTMDVITNGRNGMRPFGSQFSKEEIEAIAKHVESLRK